MFSDVKSYYGLTKDFSNVGYYETTNHKHITREIKNTIGFGKLIALSGVVGSGKTTLLRRLQKEIKSEKQILISKSLSVDKDRIKLNTLIVALFYDLATERDFKIPSQPEKRERKLCEMIRKYHKPVCLFIDEAHDLHSKTLIGLKRLIEIVQDNDGILSVVLAGHPKLKNDLRRPHLEEIGARVEILTLEGISNERHQYVEWLLNQCLKAKEKITDIASEAAINMIAEKLITPLQIQHYLRLAFEEGHRIGQKPISPEIISETLTRSLDNLESKLARNGYNIKSLSNVLNLRPAEIKSFLHGQLTPRRTEEIRNLIFTAGIAI